MANNENSNQLSGVSIALAFAALGFTYAYWLTDVYGGFTRYLAGVLILFGAVALLIEAQKLIQSSSLRLDNGGVGVLLLIPTAFTVQYVNQHISGSLRALLIGLLSIVAIFGLAGFIDFLVSAAQAIFSGKNLTEKLIDLLKILALLLSSVATIIAALKQIVR